MSTSPALPPADTTRPIEAPTMCAPYEIGDDVTVLPAYLPVPGMGVLSANAFYIDGPEPMLVDTGAGGTEAEFQQALAGVTDPTELRWVWLSHTDPDHTGSLRWILENAPDAKIITTFLAVGKLGMQMQVPMDRVYWLNPGSTAEINGRTIEALTPPSFDAPETTAFFDHTSQMLFSADTFGALLQAPIADAAGIDRPALADGMALWTTIDSPWLTHTDRDHFDRSLQGLRRLGAQRVLSSHLPPATGLADDLIDFLASVPDAPTWVGPDQAALEQILQATGD